MKRKSQNRLKGWLKKRVSFRLHMSFIMLSTVFLGMVSNFILMNTLGVDHPALRYPLTVLLSYCWFLAFIRVYIRNILVSPSSSSVLDFIDLPSGSSSSTGSSTSSLPWKGGGGKFSGGGSSGSWEGVGEVAKDVASETGKEAGSAVAGLVDDEGGVIVVLVIGGALAAIVFGSGAYFIWHSPEILSECLLQVILVSGMRKSMKSFSESEWLNHIFKSTVWAFSLVLIGSFIAGVTLRKVCPESNSLREYRLKCYR